MTKIMIEVDTSDMTDVATAATLLANLANGSALEVPGPAPVEEEAKPKAKRKTAAEKKAEAEALAEEVEAAEVEEEDDDTAAVPDIAKVRAKLKEYAALEGKPAAIAILKKHGADSIGELDAAEYAGVISDCGDD